MWKVSWSTWHKHGTKKKSKFWQESNPWPPEHRASALSTELWELMESKVIWLSSQVTGVLHTARIGTVAVNVNGDKWIKMVNFVLGNETWKVSWSTWLEHGTKKKSESQTGIEPMTPRTPGRHSIHWAMRTHREQGHLTEFICFRCLAYR